MKRWLLSRCLISAVVLLAIGETVMAQGHERRGCLVNWTLPSFAGGGQTRSGMTDIPYGYWKWDVGRTYRQLVVLVSFADCDFSLEDPRGTYDSIFNMPGYNPMDGPGCVADYFRDQSGGLLNLQFDVYGPYKTSSPVKTGSAGRNEGHRAFIEATEMLIAEHPDMDFSPYDWDGDSVVEPIVYVYAGYCGNQSSVKDDGYIWPTTGNYSAFHSPDGHQISMYSASGELWANDTSHGIGTICHEFSHCLGLPDVYPTSSKVSDLSIVDEWDLMDGGTTTNYGWCPPNYSPLEKMILGWLTPTELTADTTVTNLKPVAEGGEAFLIRQSDDEFYLLENRQWNGWDYGLPGCGLVAYHVIFNKVNWQVNNVNNVQDKPNYSLKAADGRTFTNWYEIIGSGAISHYAEPERHLHSKILSGAPYPWEDEEMLVDQLTLFDEMTLSDITQHEDGTVSFSFHTSGSGISHLKVEPRAMGVYTLSGQKLRDFGQAFTPLFRGVFIINGKKKIVH